MTLYVRRKHSSVQPEEEPSYKLIEESPKFYLAEYCGEIKILPTTDYEIILKPGEE